MCIENKKYKRLLVIGHNCFSKSGSNGRTLANQLRGWPCDKIAQFYIHPEKPDFEICQKYYCISDKDLMQSMMKYKPVGKQIQYKDFHKILIQSDNKKKNTNYKKLKNSLVYLLRELVWKSECWNKKNFIKWTDSFSPEIILLQGGDAGFLFYIAKKLSKRYNAKLVLYNTEGYYFKKQSFLHDNCISKLCYPILHSIFCRDYDSFMLQCDKVIYNCELLRDDYVNRFSHKNAVIMGSSDFVNQTFETIKKRKNHIVYAGNLGVGRYQSLMEFAKVVYELNVDLPIDVYSNIKDEKIRTQLEHTPGLHLRGFVQYEELQKILLNSKYLLHVESFSDFYIKDSKYAFSTKIADSLATGNCLIVYAPDTVAVCEYLKETKAAVLINDRESLRYKLQYLFSHDQYRHLIERNARKLACLNHSSLKNSERFIDEILTI